MATDEFERALKRLEEIVKVLEKGEGSLEESLKLFEEGIEMSCICSQRLTAAKERVQQLVQEKDGTFRIVPLREKDG
jgi:exodeoxyribonuclease VII small subunit